MKRKPGIWTMAEFVLVILIGILCTFLATVAGTIALVLWRILREYNV